MGASVETDNEGPPSQGQLTKLLRIRARYENELMRKANVVGVGVGLRREGGRLTDEPAIIVSVTHKVPRSALDPKDVIPRELDGVAVDVEAVGELHAQARGAD